MKRYFYSLRSKSAPCARGQMETRFADRTVDRDTPFPFIVGKSGTEIEDSYGEGICKVNCNCYRCYMNKGNDDRIESNSNSIS